MTSKEILKQLHSDRLSDVVQGLNTLKEIGDLGDLQNIMLLVKHTNNTIQTKAIQTVCHIIREKLVSNFHELAPDLRKKLGALMDSLHPTIVSEISNDIFSDDENRRLRAVQTLGLLRKNPQIRTVLVKLVTDRDEKIRATAVNLLGKIIDPNDQELILSLLSDKDKRVRANTVEALESVGNKRMIPILKRFRKDLSNRIRGNVLKALYNLGVSEIESDLVEMIVGKDNFMKASALWVISQVGITSPNLEDLSGQNLLSSNEMVVVNACNALAAQKTPHALGYLKYLYTPVR